MELKFQKKEFQNFSFKNIHPSGIICCSKVITDQSDVYVDF